MPARGSRLSTQVVMTLATVSLTCLTSAFTHDNMDRCEAIEVPRCRAMPYNMTRMPNLLHHSTQENVRLAFEQFHVLLDQDCSPVLLFLLCAMYVPICTVSFQPDPIPPCRDVCERARAGCEPLMQAHNVSWPEALNCARLPRYERGVCVSPEAIITPNTTKKKCTCKKKKQKVKSMLRKHQYQYAVHARLVKLKKTDPRTVTLKVHVEEVLFCSHVKFPRSNHVTLWMNSSCACPKLRQGRHYLFAGHEDAVEGKLLLPPASAVAVPWRNKWGARVKRWHQQLTKSKAEDETRMTSTAAKNPVSAKHGPRREKQEEEVEDTGDGMKRAQKPNSRPKEHVGGTRLDRLNSNQTER